MTRIFFFLSLMLIIISCDEDGSLIIDEEINDEGLPRIDKSITGEDTYYYLEIVEKFSIEYVGDTIIIEEGPTFMGDHLTTGGFNINTNWDKESGIISFHPDPKGTSPFPTVDIIYDITSGHLINNKYYYLVPSIGIQLYDVLEGTAAELNGRTYRFTIMDTEKYLISYENPEIEVYEVGANYIKGKLRGAVVKPIWVQNIFTNKVIIAAITLDFQVCTRC